MCPRTGVPLNVLGKPGLTKKFLDQLNQETGEKEGCIETQSIISTLSTISIRPKDETPEQRKDRKQLVKEYRRVNDQSLKCVFLPPSILTCTYRKEGRRRKLTR